MNDQYKPMITLCDKAGQHNGFRVVWGNVDGLGEGWYATKHPNNLDYRHVKGPYVSSENAYLSMKEEVS